jgi:outer membrane receptor protein involved in Fe transport
LRGEPLGQGTIAINDLAAARQVNAVFAELNWPAIEHLELQFAVRHDQYNDFGGTTSPMLALRWQPVKSFLVRASTGTGFLAPSLFQLHTSGVAFIDEFADRRRCPVTGNFDDCFGFFTHQHRGNPALKLPAQFLASERPVKHDMARVPRPRGDSCSLAGNYRRPD